jgi:hypothetical protein
MSRGCKNFLHSPDSSGRKVHKGNEGASREAFDSRSVWRFFERHERKSESLFYNEILAALDWIFQSLIALVEQPTYLAAGFTTISSTRAFGAWIRTRI